MSQINFRNSNFVGQGNNQGTLIQHLLGKTGQLATPATGQTQTPHSWLPNFSNVSAAQQQAQQEFNPLSLNDDREQPEGIFRGQEKYFSVTSVEVLDLISEGEIDGLVAGEWINEGTVGHTGWNKVTFNAFPTAPFGYAGLLRSVYYNEVPLVSPDNLLNYSNINFSYTNGYPRGTSVARIQQQIKVSRPIGEKLFAAGDNRWSKTYRITNRDCKKIEVNIRIAQLTNIYLGPDEEKIGNVQNWLIKYNIYGKPVYSTPGKSPGSNQHLKYVEVIGKITQGYLQSDVVNLPYAETNAEDFIGWEITIHREPFYNTWDNSSVKTIVFVDSLTEIYEDILVYPNSAVFASRFSADNFNAVPARAYDVRLLKVKVPSNYNSLKRTYDESTPWDGTFKANKEWTDNPVWCFHDLLTNPRYGLGEYILSEQIDKWTLYEISKYCDVLVSDGQGGLEPRFTCNVYINSREEAYKVVNDFASIFRGMVYYAGGTIFTSQDSPREPLFLFNNASVEDGNFTYTSTNRRSRHTVAKVRYNDKYNFYAPTVEFVEDVAAIRKYGIQEIELTAFGCSSRAQAIRLGRWAIASNFLEPETVSFTAGMEGSYIRPGDVIGIYDNNRKTNAYAGRTSNFTLNADNTVVRLDREVFGLKPTESYQFSLLTPTYFFDPAVSDLNSNDYSGIRRSQIQTRYFSGNASSGVTGSDERGRTEIRFWPGFDTGNYNVSGSLVWMFQVSGQKSLEELEKFRVIRIEEKDLNKYVIGGVKYDENKYAAIESGLVFEAPELTFIPEAPTNLSLEARSISFNRKAIDYQFTAPTNLIGLKNFSVYAKSSPFLESDVTGNSYLIDYLPINMTSGTYYPAAEGRYYFRAYSESVRNTKSTNFATSSYYVETVNAINDVVISSLSLGTGFNASGNKSYEEFSVHNPIFNWQVGMIDATETPDLYYRVSIREPQDLNIHIPNQTTILYQETGINFPETAPFSWQFSMDKNALALYSAALRDYEVVVEAHDADGNSSAGGNFATNGDSNYSNPNGYDILRVYNPPIELEGGLTVSNVPEEGKSFWTTQWISPEGDIKFNILSGRMASDFKAFIAYWSPELFDKKDATDTGWNKSFPIYSYFLPGSPQHSYSIPAGLTGDSQIYFALSPVDSLAEEALKYNIIDTPKTLSFAGPALINKRLSYDNKQLPQAVILFKFLEKIGNGDSEGQQVDPTMWAQNSYNIGSVTKKISQTNLIDGIWRDQRGYYSIQFSAPLNSDDYRILPVNVLYHSLPDRPVHPDIRIDFPFLVHPHDASVSHIVNKTAVGFGISGIHIEDGGYLIYNG